MGPRGVDVERIHTPDDAGVAVTTSLIPYAVGVGRARCTRPTFDAASGPNSGPTTIEPRIRIGSSSSTLTAAMIVNVRYEPDKVSRRFAGSHATPPRPPPGRERVVRRARSPEQVADPGQGWHKKQQRAVEFVEPARQARRGVQTRPRLRLPCTCGERRNGRVIASSSQSIRSGSTRLPSRPLHGSHVRVIFTPPSRQLCSLRRTCAFACVQGNA
jgi:hypothetical protein